MFSVMFYSVHKVGLVNLSAMYADSWFFTIILSVIIVSIVNVQCHAFIVMLSVNKLSLVMVSLLTLSKLSLVILSAVCAEYSIFVVILSVQ